MTKYRNPATLLNEVIGNSVYRKRCHIHVDPKKATHFMKGKSNGQNFFLKNDSCQKISVHWYVLNILLIKIQMQDVPTPHCKPFILFLYFQRHQ